MEAELENICSYCSQLIHPAQQLTPDREHYPILEQLRDSSFTCVLCAFIWDFCQAEGVAMAFVNDDESSPNSLRIELTSTQIDGSQEPISGLSWDLVSMLISQDMATRSWSRCFTIASCSMNSLAADLPIWKRSKTSVPEKMSIVKNWLETCERCHETCKPRSQQLPKRLINVEPAVPRLVMCQELSKPSPKYATLSYCWGQSKFGATKESINSLHQGIPMDSIPSTLQDAILTTRMLGLRYLWIDSLCIVQDDELEWNIEASNMKNTYAGSSLTIAATDAIDSSEGFLNVHLHDEKALTTSETVHQPPFKEPFFRTLSSDGEQRTVRVLPHDFRTSIQDSALNQRGWVLQEMLLSPRIAHFAQTELSWHCKNSYRTETGLVLEPEQVLHTQRRADDHHMVWWNWMTSYSRRKFTVASDRLPALLGILDEYQSMTGDQPILGLWCGSFHQDLMWMRMKADSVTDESPFLGLPSWTWLSCRNMVRFDFWNWEKNTPKLRADVRDHVALVDWEVVWSAAPFSSAIASTRLAIRGPAREMTLRIKPKSPIRSPLILEVFGEQNCPENSVGRSFYDAQFDIDAKSYASFADYTCVLLRSMALLSSMKISETFLILQKTEGDSDVQLYRRVGIGCYHGSYRTFGSAGQKTLNLA
ncbi:hypothetical protein GLAREA_08658 [Glarea lozoyensis ATCC 20868]|uniref:Heterokaryon incompatibility domain-containing protein n=1 Tax=Glarea lozoyensis (strain ATCC 20868 / MF5171) TaxID=1116229 RepID=S3DFF1_GLAL2|nr:uncharacterized protein GLAREA_08658 [Glarea lozoyensis ATCC 20868]EPE36495.1 hypothetical protein GLAREA_08658 [Glarea lozoyensis ATCC 20868]